MSDTDPALPLARLAARMTGLMTRARQVVATAPDDPARAALSFLQPRNAHPAALADHNAWLAGQSPGRSSLRTTFGAGARLLRGGLRTEPDWGGDPLPERAGLLVLSHYLGQGRADDYFGTLLQSRAGDAPTVVARLNHTWDRVGAFPALTGAAHPCEILLSRSTPLRQGIAQARALRHAARAAAHASDSPLLGAHLKAQALHPSNLFGLRTATQIEALVRLLQPEVLLLTWEGHVWERLAIWAARRARPGVTCIAYSHTALFPLQTATAQPLGAGLDPDGLLVTGAAAQDWYARQPLWRDRPIEIAGSPRGGVMRRSAPGEGAELLVAPEGILTETVALFDLALEIARRMPEIPVRLRLHPVLPRARVVRALPALNALPANVRWSEGTADTALAAARWLLYRGSTMAVPALRDGVRPVLWHPTDRVDIDPLRAPGAWQIRAKDAPGAVAQMRADLALRPASRTAFFRAAAPAAEALFRALDPGALPRLLDRLRAL